MTGLTRQELDRLAAGMKARKRQLMEEIRQGLERAGEEGYARLLGDSSDAGDQSVADLLRDVRQAEVTRDVGELRDIEAAEGRIAAQRYGLCTDCGAEIGFARLQAFPTAKRCIACQQLREKTKASPPRGTR